MQREREKLKGSLSREGLCRNSKGIFRTNSRVNFAGMQLFCLQLEDEECTNLWKTASTTPLILVASIVQRGHFKTKHVNTSQGKQDILGCGFFAYSWKLPAYSRAFLLTVDNFSFFAYSWSFFAYSFSFFAYSWSFFAYSGKVRLLRALRDYKQRS